jgi:hypothetical protein
MKNPSILEKFLIKPVSKNSLKRDYLCGGNSPSILIRSKISKNVDFCKDWREILF